MSTRTPLRNLICSAFCAALLPFAGGCRKGANLTTAGSEARVAYSQIDPATAGAVEGTIHFAHKAPPSIQIDMAQDPACAMSSDTTNRSEEYVVNDGKLANVFVYVKDGLGNRVYAAPSAVVVMDQKGCRYVPHVIGAMVGQQVEFRNSDPTMHNVHTITEDGSAAINLSQPPNQGTTRHTFTTPQLMLPARCDSHPWMLAYINVAPNPFFAVSDASGHFIINGLPPGSYTLVADQEQLGQQQTTVTVTSNTTATADFTYGKGK